MSPIKISEAEWQVMSVVWPKAPVSASQVVDALARQNGWHSRTTRTLLDRLVKKRALEVVRGDWCNLYTPKLSMQQAVRHESQSFLQRVFGGEPAAMLLHLVEEAKLSKQDIKKLKSILSEKEK